jgi:hypothetical protein
MLTPGEFVIKKSSVAKLGAANLAAMNENRFEDGGQVKIKVDNGAVGGFFLTPDQGTDRNFDLSKGTAVGKKITNPNVISSISGGGDLTDDQLLSSLSGAARVRIFGNVVGKKGKSQLKGPITANTPIQTKIKDPQGKYKSMTFKDLGKEGQERLKKESNTGTSTVTAGLEVASLTGTGVGFLPGQDIKQNAQIASAVGLATQKILTQGVTEGAQKILSLGNFGDVIKLDKDGLSGADRLASDPNAKASVEGFLFEGIIDAITGANLAGKQAAFDFPNSSLQANKKALERFFTPSGSIGNLINADAKRSYSLKDTIASKIISDINAGNTKGYDIERFASGGSATGTDTVPALLTPGEFVVNKKSAQKIGYGSLNRMNKVGKYANGGIVQHFKGGGGVAATGGGGLTGLGAMNEGLLGVSMALNMLTPTIDETSSTFTKMVAGGMEAITTISNLALTVTALSTAMKTEMLGGMLTSLKKFSSAMKSGASAGASRSQMASQMRKFRADNPMVEGSSFQIDRKALRNDVFKTRPIKPTGVAGKAGNILGRGVEKLGKTFPTFTRLLGSAGKLLGTFGTSLAGFAPAIAAAAGPIAAIAAIGAVVGGVISGFRDLDARLKDAVDAQDTAAAKSLAIAQAAEQNFGGVVAGIASLFGDAGNEFLLGISSFFGGQSSTAIKTDIAAKIQSAKTTKSLSEAQTVASKAMEDLKNGTITAADGLRKVASLTSEAKKNQELANQAIGANEEQKAGGVSGFFRNVASLGGLTSVETVGQRNRRIDRENEERSQGAIQQRSQALGIERQLSMATARSTFSTGGSYEAAVAKIGAAGGATPESLAAEATEKRNQAFKAYGEGDTAKGDRLKAEADMLSSNARDMAQSLLNLQKEVEKQRAAIAAMNMGLNSVNGAANAVSVGLNNYLASQEAGAVTVGNSLATLEASMTGAAVGIGKADFEKSFKDVKNVLKEYGATEGSLKSFETGMKSVYAAQKNASKGLDAFKQRLFDRSDAGLGGANQEEQVSALFDEIIKSSGLDKDAGENLRAKLKGLEDELDWDEIGAGDFSSVEEVLAKVGEEQAKQFRDIIKAEQEYQQAVVSITQKRIAAEDALTQASMKRIDLEMEAAQIIAEAGGPAVTTEMKRDANLRKSNLAVEGINGVGPMKDTSVASIRERKRQLAEQKMAQGNAVNASADSGEAVAGGVGAGVEFGASQQRTVEAGQDLYRTIKTEIDIRKQEISIIQAKNKLEKDSFEALASGDLEGFFGAQATQGAISSIASGAGAGDFDADTLKSAFDELKRQKAAGVTEVDGRNIDDVLQQTGEAMLQARGIDPAQASSLVQREVSGSPEEQKLNNEIQQYAAELAGVADLEIQAANLQIQAAEKQLVAAGKIKDDAIQEAKDSTGKSRGGLIYAAKGRLINFIPKGTDTVPAMLTPGEFVVNRSAVQRGNNLNILKAMNQGSNVAAQAPAQMKRGGVVYREAGSTGPESGNSGGSMGGFDQSAMTNFTNALNKFNETILQSINTLQNTAFTVKLEPTTVNINLTGTSFLKTLTDDIQKNLYGMISKRFANLKVDPNNSGRVIESASEV